MQDKAIVAIGQLTGDKKAEAYQNFVQDMFPGKNYVMILGVFRFTKEENTYRCDFEKVDVDQVSDQDDAYLKYAYRKGSSRGGDVTFTTKFGDIEKKFNTFYPKQVRDAIAFSRDMEEAEETAIFVALDECLTNTADLVKSKLLETYDTFDKAIQMGSGFSVLFEGLSEKQYLGDFKTIQKTILTDGTTGKSEKYKVVSEGKDATCSICLKTKPKLHGFASPFKYATVDKTGLVSGFFKQENNWKNYPICSECALDFELGQKYITQQLSRYFYGKSYYLIPKISVGENPVLLKRALKILGELDYQEKEKEKIASKEDFLLAKIGNEEGDHNQFSLNLLFYEENQTTKAIKIKVLLEEIFPSRFRILFESVPKRINGNSIYQKALTIKKEKQDLTFNFGVLKTFFENDFYEIIQSVFLGLPISEEVLFAKFMQKIRVNYNRSQTSDGFVEPTKWTVLKAHLTLAYLRELEIIPKYKTTKTMNTDQDLQQIDAVEEEQSKTFDYAKFLSFVENNKAFFGANDMANSGIFAVGVLIRQVFNWQYQKLDGNTPFAKKLRGYHLNPEILKNIYLEGLDKVQKYSKNMAIYQDLRSFIKEYFILQSQQLGYISNDELSFFFVAGLEFGNDFKTKKTK